MIEKILPIKSPPIVGFLHHAYTLEILLNYDDYLPGFHMNYIQINFLKSRFANENIHYLDYFTFPLTKQPWLNRETIPLDELVKQELSICDFIVDSIKQDHYVRINVDEYYIPNRRAYNQRHFNHQLQINGYNCCAKFFHVSGFDKNHSYTNHTVEFIDLEKAIVNNLSTVHFELIKREENTHCEFDINIVYELLSHYLNAENSNIVYPTQQKRVENDLYWGMDIYKGLKSYIDHLLNKDALYDIRPWHLLWEHKKAMLLRIKYLQENGYLPKASIIYDDYRIIEQNALLLRNIFLKYGTTHDDKLVKRIFDSIDLIVTKEHETINKLLLQLQ